MAVSCVTCRVVLLPLLCDRFPVYDDLCLRFMNFVRACMAHQSNTVSFIARYSTMHGQCLVHRLVVISNVVRMPAPRRTCCFMVHGSAVRNVVVSCFCESLTGMCNCQRWTG